MFCVEKRKRNETLLQSEILYREKKKKKKKESFFGKVFELVFFFIH